MNLKKRFLLFLRGETYYSEDTVSGKQTSLRTKAKDVAVRLLNAKNEAEQQPAINLQIARAYLAPTDTLTTDCEHLPSAGGAGRLRSLCL